MSAADIISVKINYLNGKYCENDQRIIIKYPNWKIT